MAASYVKKYCVLIPTEPDPSSGFYHLLDDKTDAEQMAAEIGAFQPFEVEIPVE